MNRSDCYNIINVIKRCGYEYGYDHQICSADLHNLEMSKDEVKTFNKLYLQKGGEMYNELNEIKQDYVDFKGGGIINWAKSFVTKAKKDVGRRVTQEKTKVYQQIKKAAKTPETMIEKVQLESLQGDMTRYLACLYEKEETEDLRHDKKLIGALNIINEHKKKMNEIPRNTPSGLQKYLKASMELKNLQKTYNVKLNEINKKISALAENDNKYHAKAKENVTNGKYDEEVNQIITKLQKWKVTKSKCQTSAPMKKIQGLSSKYLRTTSQSGGQSKDMLDGSINSETIRENIRGLFQLGGDIESSTISLSSDTISSSVTI